jgi:hypothetical protein
MAINKADFVGIENILDWYETNANNPYFSVWQGKLMKFGYNDEDKDKGKLLLADNLQAYQQGGHNEVLTLKLHPKKEKNGYITDKTPICASANFRVNELQSMGNIYPYISQQQQQPNDLILQKLNAIETRLNSIEEEDEEEIEEEKPQGINGVINNLFANEQIQMAMVGIISNFAQKLLTPKQPVQNTVTALAGINSNDDEKINIAIDTLKKYDESLGDDLLRLADIAENNNSQFNFLISMLRK